MRIHLHHFDISYPACLVKMKSRNNINLFYQDNITSYARTATKNQEYEFGLKAKAVRMALKISV